MDRIDLLNEIYAGRTLLEAQLARLDPALMTAPELPGGWSVKDLLAHLGWWEQRALEIYKELLAWGEPSRPISPEAVDVLNAEVFEQYRPRDLDWVREFERGAYLTLLQMVETAPEEDLFNPQRFTWTGGYPFMEWITGNTSGHYEEHLPSLQVLLAAAEAKAAPAASAPPDATGGLLLPEVRRARDFLRREGRDVDQALYEYRFGAGTAEQVLAALAHYQNSDGGFTRLEFDIQAPQSNPFATELALEVFNWIDAPRDHPVVQRAVAYLEETQDEEGNWCFAPEIYQHSLAPWFQAWTWPNLNPSGSIAGLLKRLGLGSDRLHNRVQALFDRLATPADLLGNEFYTVRPYAYYLSTEWEFPQADFYRWGVVWWLARQHVSGDLDATHFMELVSRPSSAIARRMPADGLNARLDRLLAEQDADGGWPTPYDPRWRIWNTVNNLLILRAYGRI